MARIDALPSIDIIRGFRGILDFYMWKGLPCVRAWPRGKHLHRTDAEIASALLFGAIIKAYSLLGEGALEAYREDALDQPRTARDLMVSGVYGNLHEASMSDFLNLLTDCRDFLSNLQTILTALDSIDTDELVVNVDQSVLPPLAATTTNQATMVAALQKLDDLQDALQSKALDRLIVRGEDQLFSFKGVLAETKTALISGAGGFLDSVAVPAGEVWLVTTITSFDDTSACTAISFQNRHDGVDVRIHKEVADFARWATAQWGGHTYLDVDDTIRVLVTGALTGDNIMLAITGYRMTLET